MPEMRFHERGSKHAPVDLQEKPLSYLRRKGVKSFTIKIVDPRKHASRCCGEKVHKRFCHIRQAIGVLALLEMRWKCP